MTESNVRTNVRISIAAGDDGSINLVANEVHETLGPQGEVMDIRIASVHAGAIEPGAPFPTELKIRRMESEWIGALEERR